MSNTFLSQSDFKRTVHNTDKLRVAAYIRVSTDENDQENSFEVQKAYFEETLGRNHNWTSAGVFSDYGITGTQKKNRAGFNRMMRKCTEGKIDRILCKSISRLARNTADFIRTLDTLHDCGVSIYFEKENIDTTEAVSSFVLTALAALAQEESLSISENLKWANEKRFPAGEVPNLVIYGYRYCKGKNEYSITESGYKMKNIEIVPDEAEVVRHIFTEVANGKKYVDIARGLNARHIPPPFRRKGDRNGLWSGRDIGNIIKSERYVGDVLIQKTVTVDALSHKTVSNSGEAPQYLIHDHHPAIIDRILYNAVQAVRQKNAEVHGNNRGSTRKDQILTGLVKCGCCGKNYNVRGRNRIPTWFCPNAEVYKGITPCRGQSVMEKTIIGFIKKAFFLRFGDYNYIKLLTETLKEVQSEATLERNTDDLESKIAAAEKRIEALEIKIEDIDESSRLYQILCGELSYQKDNYTKAKQELERIQQLQTTVSKHYDLRNELIEVLENQEDVLPQLFGRFLKAIIISITIKSSEHYIIRWLDGTVTEIGG